jgi:hypothetical protein
MSLKLEYKIKPIVKRFNHRPTAAEIVGNVEIRYQCYSKSYCGYADGFRGGPRNNRNFYGIRLEKHRKKCIGRENVTDDKGRIKNKYRYEPAYWLVHIYAIPVSVLDTLGLCAKQHGMKTFKVNPIQR